MGRSVTGLPQQQEQQLELKGMFETIQGHGTAGLHHPAGPPGNPGCTLHNCTAAAAQVRCAMQSQSL